MSITVTHEFVSAKSDSSDSTLVNPSNWNDDHTIVDTSNIIVACDYNFTALAPGGSLIVGSNPITLNPLPTGLAIGGYLYVSGGTGTAEAVPITGISGNVVSVTCANTHTGAWTIQSASGGLQEAIAAAPTVGSKVIIPCNITLNANVVDLGKNVLVEKFPGVTITNTLLFTIYGIFGANSSGSNPPDEEIYTPKTSTITYETSGPPNWSTGGNYSALTANVNNYPPTALFGANTVPLPEAIRGSINIPASAVDDHGSGVAGYAVSASPSKGAVGLFGAAFPKADGVSTWGINILTSNCTKPWVGCTGASYDGANNWTGYGIEIDTGVVQVPGGATPTHFCRGIYIVNAGNVNANGYAIDMDNPLSPYPTMTAALHSQDGFTSNFAIIGAGAKGSNAPSQIIQFRSVDSTGLLKTCGIYSDANGNLTLQPGHNALVALCDNNINIGARVVPNGSTPYLNAPFQLNIAQGNVPATSSSSGIQGSISWDSNYIYVCIATNTWKRTAISTW